MQMLRKNLTQSRKRGDTGNKLLLTRLTEKFNAKTQRRKETQRGLLYLHVIVLHSLKNDL